MLWARYLQGEKNAYSLIFRFTCWILITCSIYITSFSQVLSKAEPRHNYSIFGLWENPAHLPVPCLCRAYMDLPRTLLEVTSQADICIYRTEWVNLTTWSHYFIVINFININGDYSDDMHVAYWGLSHQSDIHGGKEQGYLA